jgi:transketolase
MALAQIALAIWMDHLRYDPTDPKWPGRDRFVLSCGHASMLLYSMLHLSGYDVSLDDLKSFRQWGSKTPGHPEFHLTPGVETTTGPLGQGISNAVGMALSLKMLAARTNDKVSPGRVFGICSDGDLMEGVSAEASSLAGHLGLDNLVFFYDDNKITIDGSTSLAFSEDVAKRYEAYGWATWHIDGHDDAQIKKALAEAVAVKGKPALIVARTHIGIGAPHKHDSSKAHGEPLGADEIKLVKKGLGWPEDASFLVPEEVYALFRERAKAGKAAHAEWQRDVDDFKKNGGEKAALYEKLMKREVPANLLEELVKAAPTKEAATRASSGVIEQRLAALVPSFVGGSADLNPSTKTYIEGSPAIERGAYEGRNIHFGIREHGMGAIVNGMAMSDAFIPFGSTFLIFSDYMRPTLRLAALSHIQSLFVYTHDSVYLGEDGPTHQPVEQYATIRMMPNCDFVRPCDALECAAAWTMALDRRDGPTVIALSRQNLPPIPRPNGFDAKTMMRGAYVIADADKPTLVLIATGSEVSLAIEAKKLLEQKGDRVRVVSALCYERFEREDEAYRKSVLPPGVVRVSIEIGSTAGWRGVVGDTGLTIGLDHYGASAPAKVIAKEFGFVPEAVVKKIEAFRSR